MRINRHTIRNPERMIRHNIRRLPPHTRKRHKLRNRLRHLTPEPLTQTPRRPDNISRLRMIKPRRMNNPLNLPQIRPRKRLRIRIPRKKLIPQTIDRNIRSLGRQNRHNQNLKRILKLQKIHILPCMRINTVQLGENRHSLCRIHKRMGQPRFELGSKRPKRSRMDQATLLPRLMHYIFA